MMENYLNSIFKSYLLLFYIFGQRPYPFRSRLNGLNKPLLSIIVTILRQIPILMQILYLSLGSGSLLYMYNAIGYVQNLYSTSKTDEIIANMFVLSLCVCNVTLILQIFNSSGKLKAVLNEIFIIDTIIQSQLRHKISYTALKRRMFMKNAVIAVTYFSQIFLLIPRIYYEVLCMDD